MRNGKNLLIAALVVVIIAVLGFHFVSGRDADPDQAEQTSGDASDTGEVRTEQSGTLEIPGRVTLEPTALPVLDADQKYLIELSIRAEKPEDSPGRATYFGYTLSCGLSDSDSRTISVGGTENLVNGKTATLSAAALLPGAEGGEYSCRAVVANDYEGVASAGSKVPFTAEWTATPVLADSEWVDVDEALPAVVEPGTSVDLYRGHIPLQEDGREETSVIANIHSTTCTTVSGSNEDGRPWCDEATLDDGGSEAEFSIHLGRSGDPTSCSSEVRNVAQIDGLVHHYVASISHELASDPRCEGEVSLRVSVQNDGPAPLVLHRQNTEILIVHRG